MDKSRPKPQGKANVGKIIQSEDGKLKVNLKADKGIHWYFPEYPLHPNNGVPSLCHMQMSSKWPLVSRMLPPTREQKDIVLRAVGSLDRNRICDFLRVKRNVPNPSELKLKEIIACCEGYLVEHKKDEEQLSKKIGSKAGDNNRTKRWTVSLANEVILSTIQKYGKQPLKLTARFLEKETSCPKSTIQKTEHWKTLQGIKKEYREKQGKMQQNSAHLSDNMLSVAEEMENGTVKLHTSHKNKNIEGDD
jgi:hypothetical protein